MGFWTHTADGVMIKMILLTLRCSEYLHIWEERFVLESEKTIHLWTLVCTEYSFPRSGIWNWRIWSCAVDPVCGHSKIAPPPPSLQHFERDLEILILYNFEYWPFKDNSGSSFSSTIWRSSKIVWPLCIRICSVFPLSHSSRPAQLAELPHSEFGPELFPHSTYVKFLVTFTTKKPYLTFWDKMWQILI